jgi:hypothetical protein
VNLKLEIDNLNKTYDLKISIDKWDEFIKEMKPVETEQLVLFEPKMKYPAA